MCVINRALFIPTFIGYYNRQWFCTMLQTFFAVGRHNYRTSFVTMNTNIVSYKFNPIRSGVFEKVNDPGGGGG